MSPDSRDSDEPPRGESPEEADPPEVDLSRVPADKEDVQALIRSIEESAQQQEVARERRTERRRSGIWYALLLLGLMGNAYLWIGQPDWLGIGAGPTIEEEEGMLRYRMYVEARRIEAFRSERGALPDRLEDLGSSVEGLRYRQTGPSTWELMGESGRARLVLHSAQPLDQFLGVPAGAGGGAGSGDGGDTP